MNKMIWILALFALLVFIVGCAKKAVDQEEQTQIANPASVNCIEKGGTLKIMDGEGGQSGICPLPDGTECEEWAYFRGECPKKI